LNRLVKIDAIVVPSETVKGKNASSAILRCGIGWGAGSVVT
jgi:hypothetical protein